MMRFMFYMFMASISAAIGTQCIMNGDSFWGWTNVIGSLLWCRDVVRSYEEAHREPS